MAAEASEAPMALALMVGMATDAMAHMTTDHTAVAEAGTATETDPEASPAVIGNQSSQEMVGMQTAKDPERTETVVMEVAATTTTHGNDTMMAMATMTPGANDDTSLPNYYQGLLGGLFHLFNSPCLILLVSVGKLHLLRLAKKCIFGSRVSFWLNMILAAANKHVSTLASITTLFQRTPANKNTQFATALQKVVMYYRCNSIGSLESGIDVAGVADAPQDR